MDTSFKKAIKLITYQTFSQKSKHPDADLPFKLIFVDETDQSHVYKICNMDDGKNSRKDGTWTDYGKRNRDTLINGLFAVHHISTLNFSALTKKKLMINAVSETEKLTGYDVMDIIGDMKFNKVLPKTKFIALSCSCFFSDNKSDDGIKPKAIITSYRTKDNVLGSHLLRYEYVKDGVIKTHELEETYKVEEIKGTGCLIDILTIYPFAAEGLTAIELMDFFRKRPDTNWQTLSIWES